MNKPKFTPGPWSVDSGDPFLVTSDADGLFVAVTETDDRNDDECEANTHLIAAAPEMYEALRAMYYALVSEPIVDGEDGEDGEDCWLLKPSAAQSVMQNALHAIAKAEGRKV